MDTRPLNVYECIAAVSAEIATTGIAKSRNNAQQGYKFRGIDDVYNVLAPILAKHRLVILPRILAREQTERAAKSGGVLFSVVVEAEFDFVSAADGSTHTTRSFGEGMDSADKATNKAMSAAYKYTAFQTFCIPTEGDNDADAHTHEPAPSQPAPPSAAPAKAAAPAPQRPAARPAAPAPAKPPAPRANGDGALTVTQARVAKKGSSGKGPWTLYAITLSDGQEGTTFSDDLYAAAEEARRDGRPVRAVIDGKNLVALTAAGRMPPPPPQEPVTELYDDDIPF